MHSQSCCDFMHGSICCGHGTEHVRELEKQLKNNQEMLQKQEEQLIELQTKYIKIEQLIAIKDERISQREKDYYKSCELLHKVLPTNKELKEENVKLRGDFVNHETFLENRSQTSSLQLSTSDITSVSQADDNHQVMMLINIFITYTLIHFLTV